MTDYLTLKSGTTTIKINKDKIKAAEVNEGVITLIYEDASASIVSVQINEDKDIQGFTEALIYIGELDGGYSN